MNQDSYSFESNSLKSFSNIRIDLQPIACNIDDITATSLAHTISGFLADLKNLSATPQTYKGPRHDALLLESKEFHIFKRSMTCPKLFIDTLSLSSISIDINLEASTSLFMNIGAKQLPLRFIARSLSKVLCSPERLVQEISASYLADTILFSPVVIGSLDLLGNPTLLAQKISRGVSDLMTLPVQAILHSSNPFSFMRAFGLGVSSLFTNVSEGTLMSLAGFSGSLAANLDRLSHADRFSLQRALSRKHTDQSGFVVGIQSFGQSILGAVYGIIAAPASGVVSGGALGLVTGIGSGVAGIVTKPISGALDLVSHTSRGIASAISTETMHVHRKEDSQSLWYSRESNARFALLCSRLGPQHRYLCYFSVRVSVLKRNLDASCPKRNCFLVVTSEGLAIVSVFPFVDFFLGFDSSLSTYKIDSKIEGIHLNAVEDLCVEFRTTQERSFFTRRFTV